jgi:hypothetical protein
MLLLKKSNEMNELETTALKLVFNKTFKSELDSISGYNIVQEFEKSTESFPQMRVLSFIHSEDGLNRITPHNYSDGLTMAEAIQNLHQEIVKITLSLDIPRSA